MWIALWFFVGLITTIWFSFKEKIPLEICCMIILLGPIASAALFFSRVEFPTIFIHRGRLRIRK